MYQPSDRENLLPHWLICWAMLLLLLAYNIICHIYAEPIRMAIDEERRVIIRTAFYVLAIITLPLTNLMRHILLKLNQSMPGKKTASQRYLLTIIITQSMIEVVSIFGPVMIVLGDGFNTLYIFSALGALGIVLHRPNDNEYQSIVEALTHSNRER